MHEIIEQNKNEIIEIFNKGPEGPKDAVKMLNHIIVEGDLRGVDNKPLIVTDVLASLFIEEKKQLNLDYVGDYLTSGTKTLDSLTNQLNFKDKTLVGCLREYCQHFTLPKEAEKIDRLVKAFSKQYWENNGTKEGIVDKYSAYILTYHTLMLDKNFKDPDTKNEMSLQVFKSDLRGKNDLVKKEDDNYAGYEDILHIKPEQSSENLIARYIKSAIKDAASASSSNNNFPKKLVEKIYEEIKKKPLFHSKKLFGLIPTELRAKFKKLFSSKEAIPLKSKKAGSRGAQPGRAK